MNGPVLAIPILLASGFASALDFSRVLHCNAQVGAKTGSWCLERVYSKGRKVSFLERKNCRATTGDPANVSTEEESFQGTALNDFDCADANEMDLVVLDVAVKDYKRLEVTPIAEGQFPKELDEQIRKRPDFQALQVRAPDHERLGKPTLALRVFSVTRKRAKQKTLVATYTEEGELPYLIEGNKITSLARHGGLAAVSVEAIRLNGKDFLKLNMCDIGGGGCVPEYTQLGD